MKTSFVEMGVSPVRKNDAIQIVTPVMQLGAPPDLGPARRILTLGPKGPRARTDVQNLGPEEHPLHNTTFVS